MKPTCPFFLLLSMSLAAAAPIVKRDGGRATFFDVGLGACGEWSDANEYIVALNSPQYNQAGGGYPNPAVCGKKIEITAFGKTAVARVMDECPTCGYGQLDLSKSLFTHFAPESEGVFDMEWKWVGDIEASPPPPPASEAPAPAPETTATFTSTETWSSTTDAAESAAATWSAPAAGWTSEPLPATSSEAWWVEPSDTYAPDSWSDEAETWEEWVEGEDGSWQLWDCGFPAGM